MGELAVHHIPICPFSQRLEIFVFEPHWSKRPWPSPDKSGPIAKDAELGL